MLYLCLYFWTSWQGRWLGGCFWIISGSMMLRSGFCSWTWFIVKHLGLCFRVGWGLSNTMMMRSEQNLWTWFQSDLGKSKCYNLGSWLCGVDVAALFLGRVLDFCWLWSFAQWFEIRFDLRFADPLLQGSPSYWRWFVWLWLYICAYRCRINWDDLSLWCC